MAFATPTIALIGLGVAAAGTGASIIGQRKAQKAAQSRARNAAAARQRAEALQRRRENIIAARQRRRAAGEARRFRGAGVNLAANRGAGGAIGAAGSTVPSIQGNIASQLNFNNAFINRTSSLNSGIRSAFGQAQTIASTPITAGAGLQAFGGFARAAGGAIFSNSKAISGVFSSRGGSQVSNILGESSFRDFGDGGYGYGS